MESIKSDNYKANVCEEPCKMESIVSDKYKIKAFVESRIGGRDENQDSYAYSDTSIGFLAVVCDGMGGMNGGKTASSLAVETIVNFVLNTEEQASLEVVLSKAIAEANNTIINCAQNNPELRGMGTTVTALLFNEDAVYVAHVGDSRIYQIRNNRRIFRTDDHSMVFELVKKKVITEEQARLSSQSNIITRALGIQKDVIVDTQVLNYRKNDRFILCTDGFHSVMSEKEFISIIGKNGDINIILDNLSEKIDNRGKSKGGGHDNLTAFMIEAEQSSPTEDKRRKQRYITYIASAVIALLISIILLFNSKTEKENGNPINNQEQTTSNSSDDNNGSSKSESVENDMNTKMSTNNK
ncbi:MAG: serine/threonine-protein phosphatase [Bacteroidales bacterium]|nr:serine/threonine-protein phosphatase [Bacteroidales bacterium]